MYTVYDDYVIYMMTVPDYIHTYTPVYLLSYNDWVITWQYKQILQIEGIIYACTYSNSQWELVGN